MFLEAVITISNTVSSQCGREHNNMNVNNIFQAKRILSAGNQNHLGNCGLRIVRQFHIVHQHDYTVHYDNLLRVTRSC